MTISPLLLLDGKQANANCVCLIFQKEPFPGGHCYQLTIPISIIDEEVLDFAKFSTAYGPADNQARHWFFWIGHILARINRDFKDEKKNVVLNNIQELIVDETTITVKGVCSDWISKEHGSSPQSTNP